VLAVGAAAIAVDERGDDEVASADALDVGTDVLDDADELVADRTDCMVGLAPVVPEVRPADAAEDDAHHGIRGLLDGRVGSIAHGDRAGAVEDRCTHGDPVPTSFEAEGIPVVRGTDRDALRRRSLVA
jgi:hypothetical protein